jgi:hypothetical protein
MRLLVRAQTFNIRLAAKSEPRRRWTAAPPPCSAERLCLSVDDFLREVAPPKVWRGIASGAERDPERRSLSALRGGRAALRKALGSDLAANRLSSIEPVATALGSDLVTNRMLRLRYQALLRVQTIGCCPSSTARVQSISGHVNSNVTPKGK